MKKEISYILLLLYATVMLKPMMPTIIDGMAHLFWYSHHIATVHYEHGSLHVHYDYLQAAKKESGDKSTALPKPDTNSTEHLGIKPIHALPPARQDIIYYQYQPSNLSTPDTHRDYPPPEYSAIA